MIFREKVGHKSGVDYVIKSGTMWHSHLKESENGFNSVAVYLASDAETK